MRNAYTASWNATIEHEFAERFVAVCPTWVPVAAGSIPYMP